MVFFFSLALSVFGLFTFGKEKFDEFICPFSLEADNTALELLIANGLGKRPLGFITHSLGGLLTKQILRSCAESSQPDRQALLKQTKLVAFATKSLTVPRV